MYILFFFYQTSPISSESKDKCTLSLSPPEKISVSYWTRINAWFSVYIFVLLCVRVVALDLQEDSFWPRAVWTVWIRKEKATGNQQEHNDEDWAQTSQDPFSAPYQVDEMQLRWTEKYGKSLEWRNNIDCSFFIRKNTGSNNVWGKL